MKNNLIKFFISNGLLFLLSFSCFSQTNQNTISGTVLDSNSSVVAGATIKIRNKATEKEYQEKQAIRILQTKTV